MNIEKLIDRLSTESLYADKASLEIMELCMEAATALSTLQAENEKLRVEAEGMRSNWYKSVEEIKKLRAELEWKDTVIELAQRKQREGVDAPIGSPEWNAAAGKIDTINNICEAVNGMNTCSRSDGSKAKKPVWKVKQSVVHTDYADGTANTKTIQRASWCCPVCDWFVGEQVEIFGRKHNQQEKNFCDRCGQKIDWESVEKEAQP